MQGVSSTCAGRFEMRLRGSLFLALIVASVFGASCSNSGSNKGSAESVPLPKPLTEAEQKQEKQEKIEVELAGDYESLRPWASRKSHVELWLFKQSHTFELRWTSSDGNAPSPEFFGTTAMIGDRKEAKIAGTWSTDGHVLTLRPNGRASIIVTYDLVAGDGDSDDGSAYDFTALFLKVDPLTMKACDEPSVWLHVGSTAPDPDSSDSSTGGDDGYQP